MTGTSPRLPSATISSPASRAAVQTSSSAAQPGALDQGPAVSGDGTRGDFARRALDGGPEILPGELRRVAVDAQCATGAEDAEYVTKSGQPLCRTADDLKAYMQAAMLNDKTEWDCELLRAGLRLQIEEVVGRSEDLGVAIIKARVEKGGGGSSIGYTMLMVDDR